MSVFKNMDATENLNLQQYEGYLLLPVDAQKKIFEVYNNVFLNNSTRLGIKVAQGLAFSTAKQMCESFQATVSENAAEFQAGNDAMVGMTETSSNTEDGGAKAIQKKNWKEKCPNCGAMQDNHICDVEPKPVDEDDELPESYLGFDKLKAKLAKEKGVFDPAGLAASIGDKKYGKKAMHSGHKLGESEGLEYIEAGHHQFCDSLRKSGSDKLPCNCKQPAKRRYPEVEKPFDKLKEEVILWESNFYPAKPLEEQCENCNHPSSYHTKTGCLTCEGLCSESNKNGVCFCGHDHGQHSSMGCKTCKKEGLVSDSKSAHQFRSNDYKERFESEAEAMGHARAGKINAAYENAAKTWMQEDENDPMIEAASKFLKRN